MSPIFYTKPSITEREVELATDAAAHGWGRQCYAYIEKFERMFSDYLNVPYCIATSSATGALHMGMAALGIGAGDEVVLADINWIASVSPVVNLGAKPIFVDVLRDSWCLDPVEVEKAITPRTKAILAVHLYGNLAAMSQLQAIADCHGIALIEDAAEAIGSTIHGRRAGSIGVFSAFSFHGTKTMTTGEGGMFATSDGSLAERVATLANHGRKPGETKQFWSEVVGFKYKMSNIQAAIGVAQLERVGELTRRKREIFLQYRDTLKHLPLMMNPEPENCVNGYWMPTIVANSNVEFDRQKLLDMFSHQSIDGRVFFWPLSSLPPFQRVNENPIAYSIYDRAVNLPSYHDLSATDIDRVCNVVHAAFR